MWTKPLNAKLLCWYIDEWLWGMLHARVPRIKRKQGEPFICHILSLHMCELTLLIWMVSQWLLFPLHLQRDSVSKPIWEKGHVVCCPKRRELGNQLAAVACIWGWNHIQHLKRMGFRGCQSCSALSSTLESPTIYLIKCGKWMTFQFFLSYPHVPLLNSCH